MTYALIAILAIACVYQAVMLRRERKAFEAEKKTARTAEARAYRARQFSAAAEVALQAMAERHHEAECIIAGVDIPKSIWIDGERIPVADADEDDLELGQPLLQEFPRTDSARPMQGGYDWKQEMP